MSSVPSMVLVACGLLLPSAPLGAQSPVAPGGEPAITPAVRAAVLDSARAVLRAMYVDADTGRRIANALTSRQRQRGYDSLSSPAAFASAVTTDLRSVNRDQHLGLLPPRVRRMVPMPPAGGEPERRVIMAGPGGDDPARRNFGLRKVEVLSGNIGYLEVAGFDEGPGADTAIASALRLLAHTDAVIIDLRRNGGGSGEMSHLLFSHFFDGTPRPTIRVRDRLDGTDTVLSTLATVPGPRRPTVPLYVLTSSRSASAAEEFAFVLANAGRATIVGERTAGAGHMNRFVDVGHGFQLSVSYTRVSDATTGKEWEQVGVSPTIAADASSALDVALRHAQAAVRR